MGFMIFSPSGRLELAYGTPAPLPVPPQPLPLPPLTEIECPKCQGVGWLEHYEPMLSQRCDSCFGRQKIDVCSGCGEVSCSATDDCGCNSREPCRAVGFGRLSTSRAGEVLNPTRKELK